MPKLHHNLGKIGIVLSGGSLRGAFQVGVLKALHEHRIVPAYVVGSSVGAINGAAFAAGKMDLLYKTYQEIADHPEKYVYNMSIFRVLRALFGGPSFLSNAPLRNTVIIERLNIQDLVSSPIKLDIITTDFQTGKEVIFSNKIPEHQTTEQLADALIASAAMPTIFPPVYYREHQLFDGGLTIKAPLTFAIKEGCDTIFMLLNDPLERAPLDRLYRTIYAIGKHTITLIARSVDKKDIARAIEVNHDIATWLELRRGLQTLLERDVPDAASRGLLARLQEILEHADFTFQKRRRINLHIIAPDPAANGEDEDEGIFNSRGVLDKMTLGYQTANKFLSQMENPAS
ncbi:MAG: Patatin [Parcubacteria group bacterium GW2011_GWB1_52_7]|nr:MAG: Patatin [Parcubacteria group bacterium GW2011_GWA1_51_12]KKW28847.1 MAG: Patatin [Parcubacteria group bacterium GW2011_GWB1_52_7]KKW30965.1 MAG: Patatin [Parcubacteria group bacterium GW2011_GWC2_52_8c]